MGFGAVKKILKKWLFGNQNEQQILKIILFKNSLHFLMVLLNGASALRRFGAVGAVKTNP